MSRQHVMNLKEITITAAVIALLTLGGALRAERELSVIDYGLTGLKTAEEQAELLHNLGYDGICTRPEKVKEEFFAALEAWIKLNKDMIIP